jgi:hypothetical protein
MRDPRVVHDEKVKQMQELYKEIRALQVAIPLLTEPSDSLAIAKEDTPNEP